MDITAQKQQYQALQAARAELVESAVAEITAHLQGLDPDVCKEILAGVHRQMTGEGMPKQVASNADWVRQREASTQATLKGTGDWIKAQMQEDAAKAAEHRAMANPSSDPMAGIDREAIIKAGMELWK